MTAHPLDPLTADEFRAAAAVLRRDRGVDERWRFASIELREPAKDVVRALHPRRPDPPRGAGHLLEPRRGDHLQGAGLAHRRRPPLLGGRARRAGQHDPRRVARGARGADRAPRRRRGPRQARHHRPRPRPDRHLGLRALADPRGVPGPAGGLDRRVAAVHAERQSVRQPGRRPALRGGPEHHGAAAHRGRRTAGRRLPHGRVPPGSGARPGPAQRRQGAGDHPAGRPVLHARRQRTALAELVDAAGLQPPRGPGDPPRRLPGRRRAAGRSRTGCPSPRWSSPTATRAPTTTGGRRSTSASGAWAS